MTSLPLSRFHNNVLLTSLELAALQSRFPMEDWRQEANSGNTSLGYEAWLAHRMEAEAHGALPMFCLDCNNEAVFLGDRVEATPKDFDFANEFVGGVTGFRHDGHGGFYIQVTDGDGDCFDCESSQITLWKED